VKPIIFIVIGVVLSSCGSGEPWQDPGPRASFEAYLLDLFRGDLEAAYQKILPADREALASAFSQLQVSEEERPKPHESLVVAGADTPYDIRRMEVDKFDGAPPDGYRTIVRIDYHDGRKGEVAMVWSEGQWFVDLPL